MKNSLQSLSYEIASLNKQIAELSAPLKKKIKDAGASAFAEALRPFFDENPDFQGMRWTQYTPYFNDGDVCEFSVNDPQFSFASISQDSGDMENGWHESWSIGYHAEKNEFGCTLDQKAFANRVLESVPLNEEVCKSAFGDHVEIIITRDGVEVSEYCHD